MCCQHSINFRCSPHSEEITLWEVSGASQRHQYSDRSRENHRRIKSLRIKRPSRQMSVTSSCRNVKLPSRPIIVASNICRVIASSNCRVKYPSCQMSVVSNVCRVKCPSCQKSNPSGKSYKIVRFPLSLVWDGCRQMDFEMAIMSKTYAC